MEEYLMIEKFCPSANLDMRIAVSSLSCAWKKMHDYAIDSTVIY